MKFEIKITDGNDVCKIFHIPSSGEMEWPNIRTAIILFPNMDFKTALCDTISSELKSALIHYDLTIDSWKTE
jgi:hypothetical protein